MCILLGESRGFLMNYAEIILAAAKAAKIAGALLLAVCTHETGLTNVVVLKDGGSPSYGVCQLKLDTARMFGYKGDGKGLMNVKTNAKLAAKYIAYQMYNRPDPYGDDWVKITAAYNAGSYMESKRKRGCPRNLKYVKLVQKKLEESLQPKLSCGKI